jgi:hypothetical protein
MWRSQPRTAVTVNGSTCARHTGKAAYLVFAARRRQRKTDVIGGIMQLPDVAAALANPCTARLCSNIDEFCHGLLFRVRGARFQDDCNGSYLSFPETSACRMEGAEGVDVLNVACIRKTGPEVLCDVLPHTRMQLANFDHGACCSTQTSNIQKC